MKMTKKEFLKFSLPSILVMVVLMIIPLVLTFVLSVCTYSYGRPMKFVGLRNYVNVLGNSRFWQTSGFTLALVVIIVPITLLLGLTLAIMLTKITSKPLRTLLISCILVPFAIAAVVSTLLFSWLFKDNWGVISYALAQIGLDIKWFSDPLAARVLIILHTVWAGTAFITLVLYAGLLAMPQEPLKAAEVEGSSLWQKLRYVILPHLSPLMLYCVTISIMDKFRLYDSVAVMTKGGPGMATETISMYSFRAAFDQLNLGQASCISVLMIVMIFLLIAPCLYLMRRETYAEEPKARKQAKKGEAEKNG